MRTIDAFETEISMQVDVAKNFVPQEKLGSSKQGRTIFCGTGDSYASSLLAEAFSANGARAYDPLDLIKNRGILAGKDLYLVSISGNTASNIRLANLHKSSVAVTGNGKGRLARACKRSVLLRFASTGIQTAGSASFLASALTCVSLVSGLRVGDASRIYRAAQKDARKIKIRGKVYVLGNLHTLPVAMFCAAKLYEVLGLDAHYERIEQFSHMGLFSARRGDTILIFERETRHNRKLVKTLGRCGLGAKRMGLPRGNLLEQVVYLIFVSELLALYAARRQGRKECFFVEENDLRSASSSMIY